MNYLTPSELKTRAPAATKLPKSDESLVDTAAFLRHLERQGFRPVFAAQGNAHVDTDEPLKSRHLAVAAKPDGFAIAILNSHTVWRRAWMGAGFSYHGGPFVCGHFVLGVVVPLPRWRGFEQPLAKLLEYKTDLQDARAALQGWVPTIHQSRWLARKLASTAYLRGHRRPVATSLSDVSRISVWADLINMLSQVRAGGLPPEAVASFKPPRKLKPIISPDALMHASNAAFNVGLAGLRKYKIADTVFEFPKFRVT